VIIDAAILGIRMDLQRWWCWREQQDNPHLISKVGRYRTGGFRAIIRISGHFRDRLNALARLEDIADHVRIIVDEATGNWLVDLLSPIGRWR